MCRNMRMKMIMQVAQLTSGKEAASSADARIRQRVASKESDRCFNKMWPQQVLAQLISMLINRSCEFIRRSMMIFKLSEAVWVAVTMQIIQNTTVFKIETSSK